MARKRCCTGGKKLDGFVSRTSCFQLYGLDEFDWLFIGNLNPGMYLFLSAETEDYVPIFDQSNTLGMTKKENNSI